MHLLYGMHLCRRLCLIWYRHGGGQNMTWIRIPFLSRFAMYKPAPIFHYVGRVGCTTLNNWNHRESKADLYVHVYPRWCLGRDNFRPVFGSKPCSHPTVRCIHRTMTRIFRIHAAPGSQNSLYSSSFVAISVNRRGDVAEVSEPHAGNAVHIVQNSKEQEGKRRKLGRY